MRRSCLVAISSIFGIALAAGEGHADTLSATAQVQTGYADGRGVGGAQQDDAFFEGAAGLGYGARAGVELLFARSWIEHNQLVGSGGLQGTWTQIMAGIGVDFGVGTTRKGKDLDKEGEPVPTSGYSAYYGEAELAFGYGVGTGQQVEPPLSNRQITDKGPVAQLTLGGGYRITEALSLGVQVPVQGAYLFKSGDGLFANEEETHYQSIHAAALVNLRMRLGL